MRNFHKNCQKAMRDAILNYPKVKIIAKNNCKHDFSLVLARKAERALFNYITDNEYLTDRNVVDWINKICGYNEVELNEYVKTVCAEVYKELNHE